jgi:PAS domain S-box-containing protein
LTKRQKTRDQKGASVGRSEGAGVMVDARLQLGRIIDAMVEMMLVTDEIGVITLVNTAACNVLGYEAADLVGQPLSMILGEAGWEAVRVRDADDLFVRGYIRELEGFYPTRYGTEICLHLNVSYIWEEGQERSIICIAEDITRIRQLESELKKSEEQFRDLVQMLNVIILKADGRFRLTFMNRFGLSFFGYQESELLGKSIIGTITPVVESTGRNLETFIDQMIVRQQLPAENENENVRKNGERVWVNWYNQPVFDESGRMVEIMSTGYDITERNKAAGQTRKLNSQLQQTVSELYTSNQEITKQRQALQLNHNRMQQELRQARLVQKALLPGRIPEMGGIQLAASYLPVAHIGGDFYDFFPVDPSRMGILLGDVSGHGIPAALLSALFLTTLRNLRSLTPTPDLLLRTANQALIDILPDGKYASLFCCLYDTTHHQLTFSSAGHPPAFLLRAEDGQPQQLQTRGMVVGMFTEPIQPYENGIIELRAGDKLLFYTDGILDIMKGERRLWEQAELEAFLVANRSLPVASLLKRIREHCLTHAGEDGFTDDVTLIGLEVTG